MAVRTLMGQEVIEDINDTAIIGYQNVINNPKFISDTNGWTASGGTNTITSSGLQIVGANANLYQNLNTTDVASGIKYMTRVYVDTVSGTWKATGATVASGADASGAYSMTLVAGWNSVRFTAGATHRLNIVNTSAAATDTLVISPVEVRRQVDLTVAGQIRNLDVEFSGGTIDGTLDVTSAIVGSSTLSIASAVDIAGSLVVTSTINASGSITAGVDVSVTSNLTVAGSAIFNSTLNASANISVGTTASIVGSINAAGGTFTENVAAVVASVDTFGVSIKSRDNLITLGGFYNTSSGHGQLPLYTSAAVENVTIKTVGSSTFKGGNVEVASGLIVAGKGAVAEGAAGVVTPFTVDNTGTAGDYRALIDLQRGSASKFFISTDSSDNLNIMGADNSTVLVKVASSADTIFSSDLTASGTISAASLVVSGTITTTDKLGVNQAVDSTHMVSVMYDYAASDVTSRDVSQFRSNDGTNYFALQTRVIGSATAAARTFVHQTVTQGIASDGIFSVQPDGGKVHLVAAKYNFTSSTLILASLPEASGDAPANGLFRDGAGTSILYIKSS